MKTAFVVLFLAGSLALSGAQLSLSAINVIPGGAASVEVRYAAQGAQIAALQFDLSFDASNLKVSATTGPAAASSDKAVGSTSTAPGTVRLLLVGFSQAALQDGVIANLVVSAGPGALGSYPLKLSNALAADIAGLPVALSAFDGSVTVSPAAEPANASAFGQVVAGGVWKTSFTLLNTASTAARARLDLRDNDGLPLSLPLTSSGAGSVAATTGATAECSLAPGAMCVVETEVPETEGTQAGWAELHSSDGVVAFAVLRQKLATDRYAEATIPFDRNTGSSLTVPYDNSGAFVTGIAVANRSADRSADLKLVLRDETGAVISQEALSVPAHGHTSFVAADKYPLIKGLRGTIEVQGAVDQISLLGLRFSPGGSFSSLPVSTK